MPATQSVWAASVAAAAKLGTETAMSRRRPCDAKNSSTMR
jgi:hypothetical protein